VAHSMRFIRGCIVIEVIALFLLGITAAVR
jgi:hypothetical protein